MNTIRLIALMFVLFAYNLQKRCFIYFHSQRHQTHIHNSHERDCFPDSDNSNLSLIPLQNIVNYNNNFNNQNFVNGIEKLWPELDQTAEVK